MVFCDFLSQSVSQSVSQRLSVALQTSSFSSILQQLSSPLSVFLHRPQSSTCQPRRLLLCPHIDGHRLSSVRRCRTSRLPPCTARGSDTNEAPLGDSQSPLACPPPPPSRFPSLTVNKPVAHMSKNNKKGFVCVCVCYSGVWTFNCVLFSAFAFHFENPPLIPVPEQFPPSARFFRVAKP